MINKIEFWTPTVISSLVYILAGLLIMIYPSMTAMLFVNMLAIIMLAYSLFCIFTYFKSYDKSDIGNLLLGILLMAFSLYLYFNPLTLLSLLPIITGGVLVFDGIIKLLSAIKMYKNQKVKLFPLILSVLLPFIFGIIMMVYPMTSLATLIMFFGSFIMVIGIMDILMILILKKLIEVE